MMEDQAKIVDFKIEIPRTIANKYCQNTRPDVAVFLTTDAR